MNYHSPSLQTFIRWAKFNAVGAIGAGVQLATLWLCESGLHWSYLAATGMAVEMAVLHNFFWHVRFTWRDRPPQNNFVRFLKFQTTTGLFSIAGNLLLMEILVSGARLNYLLANCLTIATCSLLNFMASDRFVFQENSADENSEFST